MQSSAFSPADSRADGRPVPNRHSYVPPGTPERQQLDRDVEQLGVQLYQRAAQCREHPREDFLSFLANLEIDGELDELAGRWHENSLPRALAGGIDTTTALMSKHA